ncbi:MAG: hypothetical protein ACWGQW_16050 [bacterium]
MKRICKLLFQLVMPAILLVCSCSRKVIQETGISALEIEQRTILGDGVSFGDSGPYETLSGTVSYTLDPSDPANARVTDAQYAASSDGLVHYSADVVIVKPVDMAHSNGALLYQVVNRGSFDTRVLNSDVWSDIASNPCGGRERMGRLMKQGFTIVFSGWEADLALEEHLQLFSNPSW